jgi:hypothetical protein
MESHERRVPDAGRKLSAARASARLNQRGRATAFGLCVLAICGGTACNNGGATAIVDPPTAPTVPGPPSVTLTSVIPASGAALLYTLNFSASTGTSCGQGLLLGGALTLEDGTIIDSGGANGFSGTPASSIDGLGHCSAAGGVVAAGVPQRSTALDNVMHVTAVWAYLGFPEPTPGAITKLPYPAFDNAVAVSRVSTNLYLLAQPTSGQASGASVAGTWTGTVQDDKAGAGTVTLQITREASYLYGAYGFTFPKSTSNVIGAIVGTPFGATTTLLLTPTAASCPLVLRLDGSSRTNTATYSPASGCSLTSSGSLTLTKQ